MEKITIRNRTTKNKGVVKLRFRLRDSNGVEMYHKSEIKASLDDLNKFNADGTLKREVSIYNDDLFLSIQAEIQVIKQAYHKICDDGLDLVSANLEIAISRIKNPEKAEQIVVTLLDSLSEFAEDCRKKGRFSDIRYRQYLVLIRQLERYLIINNMKSIQPQQFAAKDVMRFREFLFDEFKYVDRFPNVYTDMMARNKPKKKRASTTVASTLKRLKAYYKEMEDTEIIVKSPFMRLSSADKKMSFKENVGAKTGLTQSEIKNIQKQDVPNDLQEVKDAFLLQCFIGCRVADFAAMTMDRVVRTEDGIPYLHYIPNKEKKSNKIIDAPLIPSAMKIIEKYNFSFRILKNISGQNGYNKKIKDLLKYCGINRKIDDPLTGQYVPLFELASSKAARKTYLTLQVEHQPDPYVLGLHRYGSTSVENYLSNSMHFRYMLVCTMFGEAKEGECYLRQSA